MNSSTFRGPRGDREREASPAPSPNPVSLPVAKTRWIALALLAAHLLGTALLARRGVVRPLEAFNLLLLAGNIVLAVALIRGRMDLLTGGGIMFLVAAHALFGRRLVPDELTSGVLLLVNILVLYVGVKINLHLPRSHWLAFVASYFLLFFIFVLCLDNAQPLFLLFLFGLVACARSLRLLAGFWAVTLSFTLAQPFAWEAALCSLVLLAALFGARGRVPSATPIVFLGAGLSLAFLVLLPVIVAMLGETPQSISNVLSDPRIRRAIAVTAITATISTLILVAFAVPLSYALARLRFPGRTLVLSLLDTPLVVPQSAAGIALVSVFGRRQFLGETLFSAFGVSFDATMAGICLAQVFVALPFIARSAVAAFEAVPERLELAARTLGASSFGAFWRVALPLASRGVFLGAVLAWARAAGEFGAVIFIAPTPETAPVAAFNRFQSVGVAETGPLVAALLLFSMAMFLLLQLVSRTLSAEGRKETGGC